MAQISHPVEFVYEDDGQVMTRHVGTGVTSFGDALDSNVGRGEEMNDSEASLEEFGSDADLGSEGSFPWLD